jgi:hypothetical protein
MEPGTWNLRSEVTSMNSHIPVLEAMVRARGLRMSRVDPADDLLLPPSGSREDLEAYRSILDHYAARLLLKEVIKSDSLEAWLTGRRSVERFCDSRAVDDFLSRLTGLGVLKHSAEGYPVPLKPLRSFGQTYEWYTAMVLASEFQCPSAWGVTFEDLGSGGDHDVIATLSGRFLYVEVKTSPPGRIESPEIRAFVRRIVDIAPDIAVFNNDTHLRMKDKIVPLMEKTIEQFKAHPPSLTPLDQLRRTRSPRAKEGSLKKPRFERLEREIFHLKGAVYIINSKPDLRRNMEVVFQHHFRSGNSVLEAIT